MKKKITRLTVALGLISLTLSTAYAEVAPLSPETLCSKYTQIDGEKYNQCLNDLNALEQTRRKQIKSCKLYGAPSVPGKTCHDGFTDMYNNNAQNKAARYGGTGTTSYSYSIGSTSGLTQQQAADLLKQLGF